MPYLSHEQALTSEAGVDLPDNEELPELEEEEVKLGHSLSASDPSDSSSASESISESELQSPRAAEAMAAVMWDSAASSSLAAR